MPKFAPISSLVVALFIGCGPSLPAPHAGLTNEGVLLLSSDNPYVGTNRYLANEIERSTVLRHFLENRGAPQAIRVQRVRFGDLTTLYMFYPEKREYYSAEIIESARKDPRKYEDWVIKGPFRTERNDFGVLRQMVGEIKDPIFIVNGEQQYFKGSVQSKPIEVASRTDVYSTIPAPTPKPTPKPVVKKEVVPATPEDAIDALILAPPGKFRALNTDEMAIAMSKGYAEREANGDLVHSVRFDGESIDSIVKWYTGDLSNKTSIIAANKLADDTKLKGGDRVVVPFALIKNFHFMPSDFYVE